MVEILNAAVFDSVRFFKHDRKTSERITKCYEIEIYVEGDGQSFINSEAFPHKKGNLIFARPRTKRCSINRFVCLYIHLNMDEDTAALLKDIPPVSTVSDYNKYENVFLEIISLFQRNSNEHIMLIQSKVYKLFDMLLADTKICSRIAVGKINAEVIKQADEFMQRNISKPITLGDIAKSVSFSPVYFHRAFSLCTGRTPHAYLLEKRLEAAKMYLITTDYPMDKIAEKCGFSSHSYFDYQFKKAYAITPSEFRRRKYEM